MPVSPQRGRESGISGNTEYTENIYILKFFPRIPNFRVFRILFFSPLRNNHIIIRTPLAVPRGGDSGRGEIEVQDRVKISDPGDQPGVGGRNVIGAAWHDSVSFRK